MLVLSDWGFCLQYISSNPVGDIRLSYTLTDQIETSWWTGPMSVVIPGEKLHFPVDYLQRSGKVQKEGWPVEMKSKRRTQHHRAKVNLLVTFGSVSLTFGCSAVIHSGSVSVFCMPEKMWHVPHVELQMQDSKKHFATCTAECISCDPQSFAQHLLYDHEFFNVIRLNWMHAAEGVCTSKGQLCYIVKIMYVSMSFSGG